jgi:hypothetical protein
MEQSSRFFASAEDEAGNTPSLAGPVCAKGSISCACASSRIAEH